MQIYRKYKKSWNQTSRPISNKGKEKEIVPNEDFPVNSSSSINPPASSVTNTVKQKKLNAKKSMALDNQKKKQKISSGMSVVIRRKQTKEVASGSKRGKVREVGSSKPETGWWKRLGSGKGSTRV